MGGRGGGRWGNQGFGVAPHLLVGPAGGPGRAGPRGRRRSDARIREDVCERLSGEAGLDPSDVSVAVLDGVVTLDGTVPARPMKHRVEDLAAQCPGVRDVENRIRVPRGR